VRYHDQLTPKRIAMTFVDPSADAASNRHAASRPDASAHAEDGSAAARAMLVELADKPADAWLESGRRLAQDGDSAGASTGLQAALTRHPDNSELRLALAGVRWQMQDHAGASALL
jgi:thioredoxin-like negative regulator of GroEL